MKALIERQLYQPILVLPLLTLMQWMVLFDFSTTQVTLMILAKTAQLSYRTLARGYLRARSSLLAPLRGCPCGGC